MAESEGGTHVLSVTGGKLRKAVCKHCSDPHVAWAQSKRTGRWYLCQCFPKAGDNLNRVDRAYPFKVHSCDEYRERMAEHLKAFDR